MSSSSKKKQKYVNLVDSGQRNNLFRGNRNTSKFWQKQQFQPSDYEQLARSRLTDIWLTQKAFFATLRLFMLEV